jgi:N-terminal half of MaoC dehydratase
MAVMPIERGKIREYAISTGMPKPEYLDDPRAPIPPTFLSTVIFWDQPGMALRDPAAVEALASLNIKTDMTQVLSAEQEYIFHGPLPRAGDALVTSPRFDRVEIKEGRRGGRMVFLKFAIEFRSEDGDLRAECLYTSAYTTQAAVTQS